MTSILSILAVLGSAVWYHRAAMRLGKPAFAWAIAGALVYYAGFLIWMHGLLKPLLGANFKSHGFWTGMGMDLSAIGVGLLGMLLLKRLVLDRKTS